MQNLPRLPELSHGKEDVSGGVGGGGCARVRVDTGWRNAGGKPQQTEFLHLKCHLEIICVLQARAQTLPLLFKMLCKRVRLL